ncbi:hypothetical protein [Actinoallomurus sp. NPDC052274]|uniref:hypothetical protein n=1 Tax=Actinoallomurus sp. NPDC052274 TaxID=3155420 RepID=UPI003413D9AF
MPTDQGYTLDVLPGGQAALVGRFYTYVGSGVPCDVSSLTITITPASGSVPVIGPTSVGIVHESMGVYTYAWAVPASTVPGDYTVLWSATGASGPVTDGQVVTVAAAPSASPSPGVYATVAQYRNVTKDMATPDALVEMWLPLASEVLDLALVGAVYATDENSMPTDPMLIDTLMRACCRQVQHEIANNDPASVKDQYTSSNVGGVAVTRAPAATARALPPLSPRAAAILRVAGVLPAAPLIGW